MNSTLVVFLRKLSPGRVKTRLAAELGEEGALKVYEYLLHTTFQAIDQCAMRCVLYFDREKGDLMEWMKAFPQKIQSGNDLGQRMAHAVAEELKEAEGIVIIGSDCPEINAKDFERAAHLLKENDVVFGPAEDGGIYLLGMKESRPGLFEGVSWGGSDVYQRMLDNAVQMGLSTVTMKEKSDLDRLEDFHRYEDAYREYLEKYDVKRAG